MLFHASMPLHTLLFENWNSLPHFAILSHNGSEKVLFPSWSFPWHSVICASNTPYIQFYLRTCKIFITFFVACLNSQLNYNLFFGTKVNIYLESEKKWQKIINFQKLTPKNTKSVAERYIYLLYVYMHTYIQYIYTYTLHIYSTYICICTICICIVCVYVYGYICIIYVCVYMYCIYVCVVYMYIYK